MLNKWLKTKKSILVTHIFTTIHLKHDLYTHICTNINHTHITIYAHMQLTTKKWQNQVLPPDEYRVFLLAMFSFCRLRSTSAATWRISCNTYADFLNSIEFCIVRFLLCYFVHHFGICNQICVKLL